MLIKEVLIVVLLGQLVKATSLLATDQTDATEDGQGAVTFGTYISMINIAALRFTNFNVPRYAMVTAANLTLYSDVYSFLSQRANKRLYCEGPSPALASTAFNISSRIRSTALSVLWTINNFHISTSQVSPDIATLVQAIVNSSAWAQGNAMSVLFSAADSTTRNVFSATNAANRPPELRVEFTSVCAPNPCANNATCLATAYASSTFSCVCPSGYNGEACGARRNLL